VQENLHPRGIKHQTRADTWGNGDMAPCTLNPDNRRSFTHPTMCPGTHRTGGWVGPTAGLPAVKEQKSLATAMTQNPISLNIPSKICTLRYTIHDNCHMFRHHGAILRDSF